MNVYSFDQELILVDDYQELENIRQLFCSSKRLLSSTCQPLTRDEIRGFQV